jgi:TRAP-type transport system small permease protein
VLLGLMGLIAFDVVMRYVLRIPFLGAYEMTEIAMALIVFLGLPYCAATGGHVAVDVFGPLLERPAFRWVNVLLPLAGAALTAIMAWQSVLYALDSRSRGEATNMLRIDLFPFQLVGAASLALFSLVLLAQAWKALRK